MKMLLIISLLALGCLAYAPFPACVDETPNWLYDSYCWRGAPVPGLPDYATQFLEYPPLSIGKAVFYGPGVMTATAKYRGLDLHEYMGGVALMTCGNLGQTVWLQRPGHEWEGAFLVVDCARRNDLYGITVYQEEVIEVDFRTALRWGMIASYDFMSGDYDVAQWMVRNVVVSTNPPIAADINADIVQLDDWFFDRVRYSTGRAQDWKEYHTIMLPAIHRLTPDAEP